jgi:hypothetical protein
MSSDLLGLTSIFPKKNPVLEVRPQRPTGTQRSRITRKGFPLPPFLYKFRDFDVKGFNVKGDLRDGVGSAIVSDEINE